MNLLLFSIISIFLVFGGILLYRFDGKKTFFHIDAVQFVYAFLILPLLFVAMKTFLYQTLSSMAVLSSRSLFAIDTLFSVLFLYFAAAKAIHAVTKSFSLKVKASPDFDLFHISEYLHMWWSHLAMYIVAFSIFSVFSLSNLIFPLIESDFTRNGFWGGLVFGVLIGILTYTIIGLTKLPQGNFLGLMKVIFALFFALHTTAYIKFRPHFSSEFLIFWIIYCLFFSLILCSFLFEKSKKIQRWREWLQPSHWGSEGNTKSKV